MKSSTLMTPEEMEAFLSEAEERGKRTFAVDFDGTIADHEYPSIGEEKPEAIRTLLEMKEAGHSLILWTCRDHEELSAAVDWCRSRGLIFDAVCANLGTVRKSFGDPRKVVATHYLDDRSWPPFPGWHVFRSWLREQKLI